MCQMSGGKLQPFDDGVGRVSIQAVRTLPVAIGKPGVVWFEGSNFYQYR